ILKPPAQQDQAKDKDKEAAEAEQVGRDDVRLFFTLSSAHLIPDCLVKLENEKSSVKGRLEDLWVKPSDENDAPSIPLDPLGWVLGLVADGARLLSAMPDELALLVLALVGVLVLLFAVGFVIWVIAYRPWMALAVLAGLAVIVVGFSLFMHF